MIPLIQQLAQDTGLNARVSLSSSCMELAPLLKEGTFCDHIVPLLKRFLCDDSREVIAATPLSPTLCIEKLAVEK